MNARKTSLPQLRPSLSRATFRPPRRSSRRILALVLVCLAVLIGAGVLVWYFVLRPVASRTSRTQATVPSLQATAVATTSFRKPTALTTTARANGVVAP